MPKVIADITMSLDGFVTGPGTDDRHVADIDSSDLGGPSGRRRHGDPRTDDGRDWRRGDGPEALRCRRRTQWLVEGDGVRHATGGDAPVLRRDALPARAGPAPRGAGPSVHVRARSGRCHRAGSPRHRRDGVVVPMGGGDVIGRAIERNLVDELRLHLAPVAARWRYTAVPSGNTQAVPPGT